MLKATGRETKKGKVLGKAARVELHHTPGYHPVPSKRGARLNVFDEIPREMFKSHAGGYCPDVDNRKEGRFPIALPRQRQFTVPPP